MKKKRVAIIGKGTAGCLTAASLSLVKNLEISWYFDPIGQTQLVGEGSTLNLPMLLNKFGLTNEDLNNINYTKKKGVDKQGWYGSGHFYHDFIGGHGYHFDAGLLQNLILDKLQNEITITEGIVSHVDDIDADLIVDCSGTPTFDSKIRILDDIAVNSVILIQCYWGSPEFERTLTIARKYGWVFGIPLQNRMSFGYLFNDKLNNKDEIKEDLLELISQYNLTPEVDIKSINFKSYIREKNFEGRVAYNGNASFFLEPLEATSTQFIIDLAGLCRLRLLDIIPTDEYLNNKYHRFANVHKSIILCHYLQGSKYNTEFWSKAQGKAIKGYDPNARYDRDHSHWQDWNWDTHMKEFDMGAE